MLNFSLMRFSPPMDGLN